MCVLIHSNHGGRGRATRTPVSLNHPGCPPILSICLVSLYTTALRVSQNGKGPEFSMRPSHRYSLRDKCRINKDEGPGPIYMPPEALGKQVDSTKRSFNAGNFNRSDRVTLSLSGPERSPGPAQYLPLVKAKGGPLSLLKTVPSLTGMGTDTRLHSPKTDGNPGPIYKVPTTVGGYAPDLKSYPIVGFSKAPRNARSGGESCSPGPIYTLESTVGRQVNSTKPSPPRMTFGTGSRFPLETAQERYEHKEAMRRARGLPDIIQDDVDARMVRAAAARTARRLAEAEAGEY